jgi:hypothetical protein
MYTYDLDAKGERVSLGLHPQYFGFMRDFVLTGRASSSAGEAVVVR